jgi:hypothetical protein
VPACLCLSMRVHACPYLFIYVHACPCLCLSVHTWPCLSMPIHVCQCVTWLAVMYISLHFNPTKSCRPFGLSTITKPTLRIKQDLGLSQGSMKSQVNCRATPCWLVIIYGRFWEAFCLRLQDWLVYKTQGCKILKRQEGCSSEYLLVETASFHKRLESSEFFVCCCKPSIKSHWNVISKILAQFYVAGRNLFISVTSPSVLHTAAVPWPVRQYNTVMQCHSY